MRDPAEWVWAPARADSKSSKVAAEGVRSLISFVVGIEYPLLVCPWAAACYLATKAAAGPAAARSDDVL